jgi:type I restriction enzyme M protein
MLDTQTKSRIDSARNILVGKVTDPKSQVEQITIALIYKFMDDMDRQSVEMGGKPSFFKGEFKKYRWTDLLDKRMGGHERLILYGEGLEKMNENKNVPQLFRDIFKGVFLPYRDPETLNLFLKEINGFSYDHSERLGDAYEYLLSVLGTQGDAGQFRTPRHIIDFIVEVVGPQKRETVLDPACGTAGFLISAFKHIQKHNKSLSPDERARLMTNFCGYDIAPDMVRLSRVNMYLHGFPQPSIHEYDTLTSEERWDERYDVIMANPPFMTPKGGIRPHNRFSIKANRSEVLFVDYIAEHLNPGGRAGVIVPEGIIFQSQNAYKSLRRMLVENYLWAVVSLPAGVFNPYSGVKTSILFLDRNVAKHSEDVLFVKIQNEGFDLGAQRRPIEHNELPGALKIVQEWKQNQKVPNDVIALSVSRKQLLELPDCNLTGDRFRSDAVKVSHKWPVVSLGDYCTFATGGTPSSKKSEYYEGGEIPWLVSGDIHKTEIFDCERRITTKGMENSNAKFLPKDSVLIALNGQGKTRGTVALLRMTRATCNQSIVSINPISRQQLLPEFLFFQLKGMYTQIRNITGDNQRSGLSISIVKNIEIPLPPLQEQDRLVAEMDGYRKIIEAARQIVSMYRPIIPIDPKWRMVKLGDAAKIIMGQSPPGNTYNKNGRGMPLINGPVEFEPGQLGHSKVIQFTTVPTKLCKKGDLLVCVRGATTGRTNIASCKACIGRGVAAIRAQNQDWINHVVSALRDEIYIQGSGSTFANIKAENLAGIPIPLPSKKEQHEIIVELQSERALVEANRELITRMENKMRAKLAEVWGEKEGKGKAVAATHKK